MKLRRVRRGSAVATIDTLMIRPTAVACVIANSRQKDNYKLTDRIGTLVRKVCLTVPNATKNSPE